MKVKHAEVVKLFQELGMESAGKWPEKRLRDKIAALPTFLEKEEVEPKTADSKVLLKKLLKAVTADEDILISGIGEAAEKPAKEAPAKEEKAGKKAKAKKEEAEDEDEGGADSDEDTEDDDDEADEVEVEDEEEADESDEDESDDEDEEEAPKKKSKKTKKVEKDEDEEEDEDADEDESDDEDDEDEEKPAKKKKKVKRDAPGKGPGIINKIIEILKGASEKKPITKKEVHAKLCKAFPDRAADSMKNTVGVQIPYFLKSAKGLIVEKNEKGYWLDPEAVPTKGRGSKEDKKKKDKKSEKAAKKSKKAAKEESDDEDEDE